MEQIVKKFGDFLKQKRVEKMITLRDMSEKLEISLSFLCDIENNRRKPLDAEKLQIIIKVLNLSTDDANTLYDLAGRDNGEKVPADIEKLFMYTKIGDMARLALRKTNSGEITEDDWKSFIRDKLEGGSNDD